MHGRGSGDRCDNGVRTNVINNNNYNNSNDNSFHDSHGPSPTAYPRGPLPLPPPGPSSSQVLPWALDASSAGNEAGKAGTPLVGQGGAGEGNRAGAAVGGSRVGAVSEGHGSGAGEGVEEDGLPAQGSESESESASEDERDEELDSEDEFKVVESKELFKNKLTFYVIRTQRFVCPLCPILRKDVYFKYNEILQHALEQGKGGGLKGKQHRLLLQRLKDPDVRPAFGESGTAQPPSGDHVAQMLPGVPEVCRALSSALSLLQKLKCTTTCPFLGECTAVQRESHRPDDLVLQRKTKALHSVLLFSFVCELCPQI